MPSWPWHSTLSHMSSSVVELQTSHCSFRARRKFLRKSSRKRSFHLDGRLMARHLLLDPSTALFPSVIATSIKRYLHIYLEWSKAACCHMVYGMVAYYLGAWEFLSFGGMLGSNFLLLWQWGIEAWEIQWKTHPMQPSLYQFPQFRWILRYDGYW